MPSLTDYERRALCRNRRAAYLVRLTFPDASVVYLSNFELPFSPFRASNPVNQIILSIAGLNQSDGRRVQDIQLTVSNKKLQSQAGNPLQSAIRFSDLLAQGLDRARVDVKELVYGAVSLTIASFTDWKLNSVFVGRVQRPFTYDNDSMVLSATDEVPGTTVEYPTERFGEIIPGEDPRTEHRPLPIFIGDCSVEAWSSYYDGRLGTVPVIRLPSAAPGDILDKNAWQVILSAKYIRALQYVTLKVGDFPTGVLMAGSWDRVIDLAHPNWYIVQLSQPQLGWQEAIGFYPVLRCAEKAYLAETGETAPTYDYRDLAKETDQVVLGHGESVAVMAPGIGDTAESNMFALFVFVRMSLPPGGQVKFQWGLVERKKQDEKPYVNTQNLDVITPAKLQGEGYLTTETQWRNWQYSLDRQNWVIDRDGTAVGWVMMRGECGLRVWLTRQDSAAGDVVVRGIYAMPLAMWFGLTDPTEKADEIDAVFGSAGKGITAHFPSNPQRPDHPSRVIEYILTGLMALDEYDYLDWREPEDYSGTEAWTLGIALREARTAEAILKDVCEQSTMLLVRDPDGLFRLRMMGRKGAIPTWQRATRTLQRGVEVKGVPKVQVLGRDWVKNAIFVDYQENEDGSFRRTAWVNGADSDDGYGLSSPSAEMLSSLSITDWEGTYRLEIKGTAIRSRETAIGVRDYYLSLYAQPPVRVTFPMGPWAASLRVGQYLQTDGSFDEDVLLNGATWADVWFIIEDIKRSGDDYDVVARTLPATEVPAAAMVPRRVLVAHT